MSKIAPIVSDKFYVSKEFQEAERTPQFQLGSEQQL